VTLRKLAGVAPVIAVLALAAPVANASAQTTAGPGSMIPCYPYPAFCGPSGQPWFSSLFPFSSLTGPGVSFGPGPVQLPTGGGVSFGPGPVQLPAGGGVSFGPGPVQLP
jgi:hypothetical protein